MGRLIYSFILLSYKFGLILMRPFSSKANRMFTGRRNWKEDLSRKFEANNNPVAWFHVASLGEFEQTRLLIEHFAKAWPDYRILISFFSPSGFEVRKNFEPSFHISYLPFDTRKNAEFWIQTVKPSIAFFTKYEFWHHYISELKKNKIPVISFSSIFRVDQIFFKWYGGFNRAILRNFTRLFVQNKESVQLLNSISIENVEEVGDTRFDRVAEIARARKEIENIEGFRNNKNLFVCGSIWESDMRIISFLVENLSDTYQFIIAPHEIDNKNINKITEKIDRKSIRYSEFQTGTDSSVMILDTIGMLSAVYGYADAAYIGGAFGKGLHNILEASVFRIPVFFGNRNYKKFNEAVELTELGAAFAVDSGEKVIRLLNQIEKDQEKLAKTIDEYFESKKGATQKILDFCKELI